MNHWFLVGRDIMWFCIALTPLAMSVDAVDHTGPEQFILAVIIQITGIALVYFQVIK